MSEEPDIEEIDAEVETKSEAVQFARIMYVLYAYPLDMPEHVVARKWVVFSGHPTPTQDSLSIRIVERKDGVETVLINEEIALKYLRDAIVKKYPGAVQFAREAGDEPQIVETWVI